MVKYKKQKKVDDKVRSAFVEFSYRNIKMTSNNKARIKTFFRSV